MPIPSNPSPALTDPQNAAIAAIAAEIEPLFRGEPSGHDWFHVERVRNTARFLAEREGADIYVVELAALLHDVGDWKSRGGDESAAACEIGAILAKHHIPEEIGARVIRIVNAMGFKGGNRPPMDSIEGKVVQDADRLDAIGAIGIARAFAYGGHKGRILHDPKVPPMTGFTKEQYLKSTNPTLNHFHEKLLKLADLMNTASARRIAAKRHAFLEAFLREFLAEWNGGDFYLNP